MLVKGLFNVPYAGRSKPRQTVPDVPSADAGNEVVGIGGAGASDSVSKEEAKEVLRAWQSIGFAEADRYGKGN
jgi:hypothetical protein